MGLGSQVHLPGGATGVHTVLRLGMMRFDGLRMGYGWGVRGRKAFWQGAYGTMIDASEQTCEEKVGGTLENRLFLGSDRLLYDQLYLVLLFQCHTHQRLVQLSLDTRTHCVCISDLHGNGDNGNTDLGKCAVTEVKYGVIPQ